MNPSEFRMWPKAYWDFRRHSSSIFGSLELRKKYLQHLRMLIFWCHLQKNESSRIFRHFRHGIPCNIQEHSK